MIKLIHYELASILSNILGGNLIYPRAAHKQRKSSPLPLKLIKEGLSDLANFWKVPLQQ